MIALTSLYITSVIHKNEVPMDTILAFFKTVNAEMVVIVECAQCLFSLYSVWDGYDEKEIPEILKLL
jgi:hypothetical protein